MNRKTSILGISCVAAALLAGCADDKKSDPSPPALGAIIDRMGRAGVNTALTAPFEPESSKKGAVQDSYNSAANESSWVSLFQRRIASNLAILDSLDKVCGNQILAGATATAGRYDALAGVLADDELYVNTASGSCQVYLAVEANAIGIANTDCGGRTPLEDAIDRTYSVLALGALSGVGDGIAVDADGSASITDFPFLSAPN